ncbi:MAG: IS1 family transposase [Tyzzerella sp.]|nr:IS1 family transposase [Tyzzerella sp.]
MKLSLEELTAYLKEYEKVRQVKVLDQINQMKQEEIQTKLEALSPVSACPSCNSNNFVKNGSRYGLQRYYCKNCKTTFSVTTDTFMEGTTWTWEVWVKLVQMTVNNYSLDAMLDTLEKDYDLVGLNRKSVHLARHKLLYAMSLMPKPTLTGIVQVDETFFRENQKGTRTDLGKKLINVLPRSVEVRLPRRGYSPSRMGVLSPEYACVVCAVDNSNHAISIITSMGKADPAMFIDHFDQYFKDITYLCSDGSPLYKDYCILKSIPHYVRPSSFVGNLRKAGYIAGVRSQSDDDAVKELYTKNKKIAAQLYTDGVLDYIETANSMPFNEFCKIKYEYGLNLSRVNAFHNYLKLNLEKETTGVATKSLPAYVDAFTFLYNWRHDHKTTLSSMKDAEILLTELVKNKNAFTLNDMKKRDFYIAPKPTGRYLALLDKATKEMRRKTDNKFFKFDEEDRVISFDHRKYIKETTVGKLRPYGKKYGIKGYTRMKHWALYSAIMDLPKEDIEDIVCDLISNDKTYSIYLEDIRYITAHKIPEKELTYSKGGDMVDLERLFILKYDDSTVDDDIDDADEDYLF